MREEKSPFHPAPKTERYPLDPPVIPLAVVVPENHEDQEAIPVASEVKSFPTHGEPPVIFTCPLTSSFAHGEAVQIPTFHPV